MSGPSRPRLPLTVIGGYLGAGKTTLINRLLRAPGGRRLMVMVNDFGAVNIDAELIAREGAQAIALTNGCVCCTMGADLYLAIGDVLAAGERPDHLVIEASGVADPARIALVARAEPQLAPGGVVTVVDGGAWPELAADPLIGAQAAAQVAAADLVLVNRGGAQAVAVQARAAVLPMPEEDAALAPLVLAPELPATGPHRAPALPMHPAYVSFATEEARAFSPAALAAHLAARPPGLFRVKAVLRGADGQGLELHAAGPGCHIRRCAPPATGRLVAIGPAARISRAEIAAWWARAPGCDMPARHS